jgi:putative addiction module component (TIGR02574 family)
VNSLASAMDKDHLNRLLNLPTRGRIELACDWWERVHPQDLPALTAEQQAKIERRLNAYARNPARAAPWIEVRTRLWSRRK